MDTIMMDHLLEEPVPESNNNKDKTSPFENWKSVADPVTDPHDSQSNGFDCNICLDSVQDPVVTFCGHLYCWPCIYKWLHFRTISMDKGSPQRQCPVCKADVSEGTLVPLFGRGQTATPSKTEPPNLGAVIPRRPHRPTCGLDSLGSPVTTISSPHHQSQLYGSVAGPQVVSQRVTAGNMYDPVIGMFGEMIYARVFGNSVSNIYSYPNSYNLVANTNPRMRRHVMQAERSLSRICFFIFCCVFLCFLTF